MLGLVKQLISQQLEQVRLPPQAKLLAAADKQGPGPDAIDPQTAIRLAFDWLCAAQDATSDGGVARDFSLINGWATSYPETTGYIIPTFLALAETGSYTDASDRAQKMLDWLVDIQFDEGGFQGGKIDARPRVPVTFNTGQILIGLAAGTRAFGDIYRPAMSRAAIWLRDSLDPDGCWRRHPTPFAAPGEKAYETHVAWGLYEAARVEPDRDYQDAASRNVDWALTKQTDNGWFHDCCLEEPEAPLTHTLGYVLRGVLEAYEFTSDERYLQAAQRTADGLRSALRSDGRLAGRLNPDWSAAVDWVCLTGNVQIAYCWLRLHQLLGRPDYLAAGQLANRFVRRTLITEGDPTLVGGIRGSYPVNGNYGRYEFLNWAAKFFIDAHLKELELAAAANPDNS